MNKVNLYRIKHGENILGVYFNQRNEPSLIRHSFDSLTGNLKGKFIIERQDKETKNWEPIQTIIK